MVSMETSMDVSDVEARQLILGTIYASTRDERKHVDLEKLRHALRLDDEIFDRELQILIEKNIIDKVQGRVNLTQDGEMTIDARIMSYCPYL